jgi:universal stress protein A
MRHYGITKNSYWGGRACLPLRHLDAGTALTLSLDQRCPPSVSATHGLLHKKFEENMTKILTEAPPLEMMTADYRLNIKKILVAVDLSPDSEETAFYAARLAKRLGAYITLVHVCSPKQSAEGTTSKDNRFDDPVLVPEKKLESLAKKIRRKYQSCSAHLCVGEPANKVIQMADILHADLILVGSRDSTFLGQVFGFDQTTRIAHQALCPVLVYSSSTNQSGSNVLDFG